MIRNLKGFFFFRLLLWHVVELSLLLLLQKIILLYLIFLFLIINNINNYSMMMMIFITRSSCYTITHHSIKFVSYQNYRLCILSMIIKWHKKFFFCGRSATISWSHTPCVLRKFVTKKSWGIQSGTVEPKLI